MQKIPQRRPFFILVRLKRRPEFCQDDITRLKGALPAITRAVVFDEHVIGLVTMTEYNPVEILQEYGHVFRPFESVDVLELGSASASTNSLSDPFHSWMEIYVRRGTRRESDEAEDMLKKKWGKRLVERPEYSGVADAIRKVFSRTPERE